MSWKLFVQIVLLIIIAGAVLTASRCAGKICYKLYKKGYVCQMMGAKKAPMAEVESQKGTCHTR